MKSTTAETLRTLFDYEPESGIFRWRVKPSRSVKAGDVAGSVRSDGYIVIAVNSRKFLAHRLAYLHFHSVWPEHHIDHINGNPADNRIANLRDASRSVNAQNITRPPKSNTSGFLGVSLSKDTERWRATIYINKRSQHIGYFKTAEAAYAAYLAAKLRLHPGDVRNLAEIPS